jgi:hypothetical protein
VAYLRPTGGNYGIRRKRQRYDSISQLYSDNRTRLDATTSGIRQRARACNLGTCMPRTSQKQEEEIVTRRKGEVMSEDGNPSRQMNLYVLMGQIALSSSSDTAGVTYYETNQGTPGTPKTWNTKKQRASSKEQESHSNSSFRRTPESVHVAGTRSC